MSKAVKFGAIESIVWTKRGQIMYEKFNQAYSLHPDFFDPIHKEVTMDWDAVPPTIAYYDERPSVTEIGRASCRERV